jgi:glyoxylase-like metal-dependent hydrolase (beta-lactamase superfamily II)
MHAVHQPPGHTRADFIVHFENAGVLWLGNAFLPRAYPEIDVARGGSIDSLITEVGGFTDFGDTKIVPGRGPVSTSKDVAAYRDMLVAVRDRVRALSATGQTIAQIIAAKPTAAYDARYGNGDRFVEQVYRSLNR